MVFRWVFHRCTLEKFKRLEYLTKSISDMKICFCRKYIYIYYCINKWYQYYKFTNKLLAIIVIRIESLNITIYPSLFRRFKQVGEFLFVDQWMKHKKHQIKYQNHFKQGGTISSSSHFVQQFLYISSETLPLSFTGKIYLSKLIA